MKRGIRHETLAASGLTPQPRGVEVREVRDTWSEQMIETFSKTPKFETQLCASPTVLNSFSNQWLRVDFVQASALRSTVEAGKVVRRLPPSSPFLQENMREA